MRRYGWDWPQLFDPERARAKALGATWQPAVFVIDPRGHIVSMYTGAGHEVIWTTLLAPLKLPR